MVPMDAWGLGPDLYRSMRHWKLLAKAWPAWRQIPILSFRLKPSVRLKSWTRATKRSRSTCAVESLWRVVSYYWIFTESASATVAATFSLFQHVEFALDRFQSRSIHTCMHAYMNYIYFTFLCFTLLYITYTTNTHTYIHYIHWLHTYIYALHYITSHHITLHNVHYLHTYKIITSYHIT